MERSVELDAVLTQRRVIADQEVFEKVAYPSSADAIYSTAMQTPSIMQAPGIMPSYLGSSQQISPRFGTSDVGTPRATAQEADSALDAIDHADLLEHDGVGAKHEHLMNPHTFVVEQCESEAEEEPEREDRGSISESSPAESPLCRQNAVTSLPEAIADDHYQIGGYFASADAASSAKPTPTAMVNTAPPVIPAPKSAMVAPSPASATSQQQHPRPTRQLVLLRETADGQSPAMPTSATTSSTSATQSQRVRPTGQPPLLLEVGEEHSSISPTSTATSPASAAPQPSPGRPAEQSSTLREAVQGRRATSSTSATQSPVSATQPSLPARPDEQYSTLREAVQGCRATSSTSATQSPASAAQPSLPARPAEQSSTLREAAQGRRATSSTSATQSPTSATQPSLSARPAEQSSTLREAVQGRRATSSISATRSPASATQPSLPARPAEQSSTLREAVQGRRATIPTSATQSPASATHPSSPASPAGQLSTEREAVQGRRATIPTSATPSPASAAQPSPPAHPAGYLSTERETAHGRRPTISTSATPSPTSAGQPSPSALSAGQPSTLREAAQGRCLTISTSATLSPASATQPSPPIRPAGQPSTLREAAQGRRPTFSTSAIQSPSTATQPSTLREAAQGYHPPICTSTTASPGSATQSSPVHPVGQPSTLREAAQEHSWRTANGYAAEAVDAHQYSAPVMRGSWSNLPPVDVQPDGASTSSQPASQGASSASWSADPTKPRLDFLPGKSAHSRSSQSTADASAGSKLEADHDDTLPTPNSTPRGRGYLDEFGDVFYDFEDHDVWDGWTGVVNECRMFYYHEERNITQWECPPELYPILGEWKVVKTGHADSVFWHNDVANLSLWADPTKMYDCFEAALKGNVWFLHVYNQLGGNLRYQHPTTKATVLHYAMCGGSAACVHYLLNNLPEGAVNDVDLHDNSALIYGVRYGYWNLCKLFADARCNTAVAKKAYDLALELDSHECVKVLERIVNRRVSFADEKDPSPSEAEMKNREAPREDASGRTLFSHFRTALASMIRPTVDV